ncbi:chemotaxis protein CheA [Hyalangium sp.]|uniref:chemotaxis protein CheA n=1 Tax=Hyalangium sp. TaxID=2028555 RepID=UPI002D47EE1B|nr:chemotaxis protein CheA [Hyalangium sp.]HYH97912.1 chemotaxis protein CheA [Hyalangium sp.]
MKTDMDKVRAAFRTEATELLAGLERDFLALEAVSEPGQIEGVQRSIHTLKGNSLLMGFPAASDVAHTVEDLIARLSRHARPVTHETVTLLLQAVDMLRLLIVTPGTEGGQAPDVPELQRRLKEAARAELPHEEAPEREGASSERQAEPAAHPTAERTLRVGLDRLDRMLDLTGEIAIARGRLTSMLEQPQRYASQELLEAHRDSDRLYLDLQELVLRARMVPIGRAFQPFARTLRDLCEASGKLVRLEVSGEDVEVDTTVVELIRDPLMHLVRNAVDHGIEAPSVRKKRGKEYYGTLKLRAFRDAGSIVVEVEDDGVGLDRERIHARALALGLLGPGEEREDSELFQFIFAPGFSTAERVTELSGRGIGMDVVKRNIESLRGSISIDTRAGAGTTIHMRLPLTLSIIEGFSVGVGEETYVLPLESVLECVELPDAEKSAGRAGVLNLRGHPLPFLRLRDHFAVEGQPPARESVVVVSQGRGQAGLAVDTLLGQGQTVVKPLGKFFQQVSGVSGSAILGTGRVALILDIPSLFEKALRTLPHAAP